MRDLTGEAPNAIAAERSRVATEGWGAQLLAAQPPAGYWGDPRKWDLVTLYSLVVLKDLGLDPTSKEARQMINRVDKRPHDQASGGLVYLLLALKIFSTASPCE